jgi:hypothetical protein
MTNSAAVEKLIDAILDGQLSCYQATGSAYVVQYQDGKQEIVYNPRNAKRARPDMKFEVVATARWGEDCWTIYFNDQAVAAITTNSDGTADIDVYYYPV